MKHWNVRGVVLCLILLVIGSGWLLADDNMNCTIIVPDAPFTAAGLATPYQLTATDPMAGPCSETNPVQSAFVQAAILDLDSGQISIYNPLVIDKDPLGATAAAAPVKPILPRHAVVAIWFGFNGGTLTQAASSDSVLKNAHCVNGLPNGNLFGQYSYCNAPAFFRAANQAIRSHKLRVPPLGIANDHLPCPTVRDFSVVDQDQSDNLPVTYLMNADGHVAQNNVANYADLTVSGTPPAVFGNPSDNGLLDRFIDPAIGCTPWKAADLADPGNYVPALALNELQAQAHQKFPIGLIPAGDPMTRDDAGAGPINLAKVNAYRVGVNQPVIRSLRQADTARYCRNLLRVGPPRLLLDQAALTAFKSPVASAGDNLFLFLAGRFMASYELLGCAELVPIADPVSTTMDSGGKTLSATINLPLLNKCKHYLSPYDRLDRAAEAAEMASQ